MKPLTISCFLALALGPADAAVDPVPADGDWSSAALKAQSQFQQHQYAEAEQSSRQALRLARRFGEADKRVAMTYYQLGNIYRDWGHCAEAKSNYSRSIAAWDKQSEPTHGFVLNSMLGLLGALCECDQFDIADKTFRGYSARFQHYQSGALDQAQILSVLAAISRGRKNYGQAEADYRRAIQLLENDPGSASLQIEEDRCNLAMVVDSQGRHAESLALSEQVIAYFDRTGVSRPVILLATLNNAACALASLNRRDEAKRMFERAVTAAREAFGDDTRFTAKLMLNYARVLRENKERPAAEAMQKKGSEAFRRALLRDSATVDITDLR